MPSAVDEAVSALRRGRLVVYPTDTLLGLGARAADPSAVGRLFAAKERPAGMPVSVAVSSLDEVEAIARLDGPKRALLRRALPGPYTFLLPVSAKGRRALAPSVLSAHGAVGVRIPDHPVAREIARRVGPVVCTSANRHGRPPCRTVGEARRELGDRVERYLSAGPAPSGTASMVIDLTGTAPTVVRSG